MNKKELKRYKKAELMTLATKYDFGFVAKKKMTKVELVENIFRSSKFKEIKDSLEKKNKKQVSQKTLENLKKGREMRKKETNHMLGGNPEVASAEHMPNKKEQKIASSKEEKKADIVKKEGMVMKAKPVMIETQVVEKKLKQVELENVIPVESLVEPVMRIKEGRNNAILMAGAKAATGFSGEKVSVIDSVSIKKQKQNLKIELEGDKDLKEQIANSMAMFEDKQFAAKMLAILQLAKMTEPGQKELDGNKVVAEKPVDLKEEQVEGLIKDIQAAIEKQEEKEDVAAMADTAVVAVEERIKEIIAMPSPDAVVLEQQEELDYSKDKVEPATPEEAENDFVGEVMEDMGQAQGKAFERYYKLPEISGGFSSSEIAYVLGLSGNLKGKKEQSVERVNNLLNEGDDEVNERVNNIVLARNELGLREQRYLVNKRKELESELNSVSDNIGSAQYVNYLRNQIDNVRINEQRSAMAIDGTMEETLKSAMDLRL